MAIATPRMPCMFVTHGGGPLPLLGECPPLAKFLKKAANLLPARPTAILVVTAHWEETVPTMSTHPQPPMLYDYYGFPRESYEIKYPAPGGPPELVSRVKQLLSKAGLPTRENNKRGFDHGTFVPLVLMFPDAKIPVLQMSVMSNMSPQAHHAMGAALQPLRDDGVLILGSGSSFHNMRGFFDPTSAMIAAAKGFDDWLAETCTKHTGAERQARLDAWADAPGGKQSHPREEHLVPLMVVAGAAGHDQGQQVHQFCMGSGLLPVSSFLFQ